MAVPAWVELSAAEKRAQVLDTADELFARDGVDAPMPLLARRIGVGVGSVYRLFPGKQDIVAALVVGRIDAVAEDARAAADEADPVAALRRVALAVADRCADDWLARHAWEMAASRPDVAASRDRVAAALELLVGRARDAGGLAAWATADDLRLAFRAAKQVEQDEPGSARRLVELVLRGMAA